MIRLAARLVLNLHSSFKKKELKSVIKIILLKDYGFWEGSLFPDSMGVSEAIARDIFGLKNY